MATEIKLLIEVLLKKNDNWKYQLLSCWPTIVGNLASNLHIEKMYDDVLVLAVHNSSLMHELYLLSDILLKKINETLDRPRIKRIHFKQVGMLETKQRTYQKRKERKSIPVVPTEREKAALEQIHDHQLKNYLHRFLVRCYQEKI